jgi:hypothetical protein
MACFAVVTLMPHIMDRQHRDSHFLRGPVFMFRCYNILPWANGSNVYPEGEVMGNYSILRKACGWHGRWRANRNVPPNHPPKSSLIFLEPCLCVIHFLPSSPAPFSLGDALIEGVRITRGWVPKAASLFHISDKILSSMCLNRIYLHKKQVETQ